LRKRLCQRALKSPRTIDGTRSHADLRRPLRITRHILAYFARLLIKDLGSHQVTILF
jgi:hypothetical protein